MADQTSDDPLSRNICMNMDEASGKTEKAAFCVS
jgi:hypothetical protein